MSITKFDKSVIELEIIAIHLSLVLKGFIGRPKDSFYLKIYHLLIQFPNLPCLTKMLSSTIFIFTATQFKLGTLFAKPCSIFDTDAFETQTRQEFTKVTEIRYSLRLEH